jgi:hypothetical protein
MFKKDFTMENQKQQPLRAWAKPEIILISSNQIEKGTVPKVYENTVVPTGQNDFLTAKGGDFYVSYKLSSFAS